MYKQLVEIDRKYSPKYSIEKSSYYDECPFAPNDVSKNKPWYVCGCGTSYRFNSRTKFDSHVKGKGHKKWVDNFRGEDLNDDVRQLRIDNGRIVQKMRQYKHKIKKLEDAYSEVLAENRALKERQKMLEESAIKASLCDYENEFSGTVFEELD